MPEDEMGTGVFLEDRMGFLAEMRRNHLKAIREEDKRIACPASLNLRGKLSEEDREGRES